MRQLLILLPFFLFLQIASGQQDSSFPESWIGKYVGKLEIFTGQGLVQELPMELHILPIDSTDNYTWTIIYGEDKVEGARNYILIPTDPENGLYTIDEQNTILIEGYLRENNFIQVFSVMQSQIIATTKKTDYGLHWEIIANSTEPVSSTGNDMHEGEEIPEVLTFPVSAYQRAHLVRID